MQAVLESVKRVVRGGNKPHDNALFDRVKLEKAVTELRKIEESRREIVTKQGAKQQAISDVLRELQAAGAGGLDSTDVEIYKKALREWAMAQPMIAALQQMSMAATRAPYTDPGCIQALKSTVGDIKGPLIRVCELRIAEASEKHAVLLAEEQELSDARHGKGKFDASESAPVREAKWRVEGLSAMLEKIVIAGTGRVDGLPLEQVWADYAKQLLSDES